MKDRLPASSATECGQSRILTGCPYPGLRPFGCDEAQRFFGRARQIGDMLARLEDHRFMAVVGVSGCGKSSLVRAGLIPAIQDGYLSGDMETWRIALMRPGNAPFARLTEALLAPGALGPERAEQPNAPAFLESTLRRGRMGLTEAVLESHPPENTGLLLVVDQFEELFRFRMAHSGRVDADAFVDLLLASVNYAFPGRPDSGGPDVRSDTPIMVILTMRSDFLGDCALFTGLPEAINDSQFLTPRLTRDQYRDAIRKPARSVDGELTQDLVSQLLNDMGEDPDQLPVLQHALMRMWTRASARANWDRTLGLDDYKAIGGLAEALSNHCDKVWGALADDARRHTAEVLFRALSERGGDGRDTRHPETLGAVASVAAVEAADLIPIVESFRRTDRSFLTPPAPEPLGTGTMLDISHESLISHWVRLNDWVEGEAESATVYRRLLDAARRRRDGRAAALREEDLRAALAWQTRQQPTAAWAERYGGELPLVLDYLDQSRKQEQAERTREEHERQELESARQRELARARELVDEKAESARNMLIWLIASFVLLIGALGAAVYGFQKKAEAIEAEGRAVTAQDKAIAALADAKRQEAEAIVARQSAVQRLANWFLLEARGKKGSDPQLALLLAIKALDAAPGPATRSAVRELLREFRSTALIGHTEPVIAIGIAPDGLTVASGSEDGTVWLWEPQDPLTAPRVLYGHADGVRGIAFAPDGHTLASASRDGTIRLWDLGVQRPAPQILRGHQGTVEAIAFAPDGTTLASAGDDGSVRLWNPLHPRNQARILRSQGGGINAIAFDPTGVTLASASDDGNVRLWTPASPDAMPLVLGSDRGHEDAVNALAFHPDGRTLASAGKDKVILLWPLDEPRIEPRVLRSHDRSVNGLAFSPDGQTLASTSKDRTLRLWDLQRPQAKPRILRQPEGESRAVAFSSDGQILASASTDRTVRLWDLAPSADAAWILRTSGGDVSAIALAPDGHTIASASKDGQVRLWDLKRPEDRPRTLSDHKGWGLSVAFSPDGRTLASGSTDKTVRLWDPSNPGAKPGTLIGHDGSVRALAFAPDGRTLASGADDTTVRLWDLSVSGADPRILNDHEASVQSLAFSPDGRTLASASADQTLRLWDLSQPAPSHQVLTGHEARVRAVAFSPDGSTLASASYDGTVRLWNPARPGAAPETLFRHEGSALSLAFSRDGRTLASGSNDYSLRLWDLRARIRTPGLVGNHEGYVPAVLFSADDRTLISASGDGTVRLWDLAARGPLAADPAAHPDPDAPRVEQAQTTRSAIEALRANACARVGRNLSEDEWSRYLRGEAQSKTCTPWPIHPSYFAKGDELARAGEFDSAVAAYHEVLDLFSATEPAPLERARTIAAAAADQRGLQQAQAGDIDGAVIAFREAQRLDQTRDFDAQMRAARVAADTQVANGDRLAGIGDLESAAAAYQKALELDPALSLDANARARRANAPRLMAQVPGLAESGQIRAALSAYRQAMEFDPGMPPNAVIEEKLCWRGSLWNHPADVLAACERAVALDPDNGSFRDSRGLARALLGDPERAIADFRAYLEWAPRHGRSEAVLARRRAWIEALEAGRNPFDAATLESLR